MSGLSPWMDPRLGTTCRPDGRIEGAPAIGAAFPRCGGWRMEPAVVLPVRTRPEPPVPLSRLVGAAVLDRRLALGLSQVEVAAASGIDRTAISRVESGQRLPGLVAMVALARALGCQPGELLGGA